MQLKVLNSVPEDFFSCSVTTLHDVFGGPTLIHLKGKNPQPLFLSTLLHGNETTSFDVLLRLLTHYRDRELPRDLIIFIGNTSAAVKSMRHLPDQADYNRIWEPSEGDSFEYTLAAQVIAYAKKHEVFASIDIHNNTGKNPLYGCINKIEPSFMALASHFGSNTVYFTEPHNVQSMAFSKFCTSITVEAGLPSEPRGIIAAYDFVEKILHMEKLEINPSRSEFEIYHTFARMKVSSEARIDFENNPSSDVDLSFIPKIDSQNFEVVLKNTHLGFCKDLKFIRVEDDHGRDITSDFLRVENNEIITNRVFIPSMFTKDVYVMKEDCLGYVMEVIIPAR